MKSITQLNILNKKPTLYISYEGLEAIKHIVSIAPQEAQWFHTIELETNYDNVISLFLSDRIYIPEQNTSVAEVNSTSEMLIKFYKELSQEFKMEEVNEILKNMGCWCHSHHNMGVSPSGQDITQFTEFVNSSIEQNQNTWQIMLIFNKKNEFYCRAFDPKTGIIYEGLDLEIYHTYDFEYIDKASKTKFKKPKPIFKNWLTKTKEGTKTATYASIDWLYPDAGQQSLSLIDNQNSEQLNEGLYDSIAEDIFNCFNQKTIKFNSQNLNKLIITATDFFDEKEFCLFSYILTNKKDLLLKSWTIDDFHFNGNLYLNAINDLRLFMSSKTKTKKSLIKKTSMFLDICDLKNKDALKIIKENF